MSELSPVAQQWFNVVLIWLGFGTAAGLLARALIPGREPAGAMSTLLTGVVGSTAGPLALSIFLKRSDFNPISPLGLLTAIAGAAVLLIAQRIAMAWLARREADDDGMSAD